MVEQDRRKRIAQLTLVLGLTLATLFVARAWAKGTAQGGPPPGTPPTAARIEVAFVLDTTGSMSGLLEGAKQKIWSIANQLASSTQQTEIRVGLIGYRDRGDQYVTQRYDLSDDIDAIYGQLQAFQAGGGGDGPESVNQALHEAVTRLSWSRGDDVYRVVFLVGDAPPHMDYQDDVAYARSARAASRKGIILNTIQCGTLAQTTPIWQEIARIGLGQYAAIAQDGAMVAMETPMDEELVRLNREISETVVAFGDAAEKREQREKLGRSLSAAPAAAAARLSYLAKSGAKALSGRSDLVDAVKEGLSLSEVEADDLPEEMQALAPRERERFVEQKRAERDEIQARIGKLSRQRDSYVKNENERLRSEGKADGFDLRVFETVREQAAAKGILYE